MGFVFCTNKIIAVFVFGFLVLDAFFSGFGSNAQLLPEDEVQILQTISRKLQLSGYWNISRSSCTDSNGFNKTIVPKDVLSNVACDCSPENGSTISICHVKTIELKGLNLVGVIPEEFGSLTHLEELDLTRNYLNGSIPLSLSRAPLRVLSALGNRFSGSIPSGIGEFTMLRELVLENNLFDGPLPPEIGRLSNLERLLLSANNFTGPIPETFVNLLNLTDFRIDGTRISEKIPEFIGNWTKLDRLDMQGTSMEGPFPSSISNLKNLTELRISDLGGPNTTFPDLRQLKLLKELVLRNCLINDEIPKYIQELTNLKTLDLSFNKLTGEIPKEMETLTKLDFLFLTNNSLTGKVPSWIISSKHDIDVSYNNFTDSTQQLSCSSLPVNLISSYKDSEVQSWCLKKDLPCATKPKHHSLFIDCGGPGMDVDGNKYELDLNQGGPASFFTSPSEKWAYSSTGVFVGNENLPYITSTNSSLNGASKFYETARLAPQSLKYYGLCLREGSYKVQLHFAEIMFFNDQSFSSLGRRIFDISIQGSLLRKDFNIMEKAGGAQKGITETFDNVLVKGSTLEIHLYWAGKGTNAIPERGVYGPLISAITVTPNFSVNSGLSVGAIIGIVAASCVVVACILLGLRMKGYLGGKDLDDPVLRDKGTLSDGRVVAVKQLSSKSKQGNREFVNEIGMISALQHPNLVRLYGCCIEGNQLLLVYEYLENNSLARALFEF
ncbi:hypothetical protein F8388_006825 [Cannabis sativa]|uniref:non-specific serine/threonine protein kinase n=1 Tax=Cannabis sativa TaxID=3483 RepID=A0A7J6GX14_CANSA|nr:hypothetical protein F8388_006825 [Cannabis sativa]